MADSKDTLRLYHHTSFEGAAKILQSGYNKESTDTKAGAVHGPGTYMTSYGPDKSRSEIAKNNHDNVSRQGLKAGKTDVAIAVDIPKSQVSKADSDRDIWVAKGNVSLADKNPGVYVRDKDGKASEYKLKK